MLQIPVVVKLTGLLLLTPNTADHRLPMHVLMPVPHGSHLAQIGYRQTTNHRCDSYDLDLSICYRNMEGYYMDIGSEIASPGPNSVVFKGDIGDVSDAGNARVDPSYFGNNPGPYLRARITLRSGTQTGSCNLGRWSFNGDGWAPLANVVTWSIPNGGTDSVLLTRRRFRSEPTAPPEILAVLRPVQGRPVELFIRQIPPNAARLDVFRTEDERTHDSMHGLLHRSPFKPLMNADHFEAFYDLLGLSPSASRPLPRLWLQVGSNCLWARSMNGVLSGNINPLAPGTPTCMVAGGTPP